MSNDYLSLYYSFPIMHNTWIWHESEYVDTYTLLCDFYPYIIKFSQVPDSSVNF